MALVLCWWCRQATNRGVQAGFRCYRSGTSRTAPLDALVAKAA
jgi:hypothetical protein